MRSGGAILVGAAVCALAYLLVGCVGELIEILPTSADMGLALEDLAPAPPQEMGDGKVHFFPDIQRDIDMLACSANGCHGTPGNPPVLKAGPSTDMDKQANYDNFVAEIDNTTDPTMSTLIKFAMGMGGHPGGQKIMMGDAVYQRWIDWIKSGELK